MKLYFYGHEMVSQPKYPPVQLLDGLDKIRDQMVAVMQRYNLQGLSAPQVGIMLQFVVVKLHHTGSFLDLINPEIHQAYGPEAEYLETCISCPPRDNGCKVARMQVIHVSAGSIGLSGDGDYRFVGEDSRVVQHEIDHLSGTFFLERASRKDRVEVIRRFKTWRHDWKQNNQKENQMATAPVARQRAKRAIPDESPLEAPMLMCGACGSLLKPKPVMGPRNVETVLYSCENEETGCKYEVTRKVPAQNAVMKGFKVEAAKY